MEKRLETLDVICSLLQIIGGMVLVLMLNRTIRVNIMEYARIVMALAGFAAVVKFYLKNPRERDWLIPKGASATMGIILVIASLFIRA